MNERGGGERVFVGEHANDGVAAGADFPVDPGGWAAGAAFPEDFSLAVLDPPLLPRPPANATTATAAAAMPPAATNIWRRRRR